MSVSVVCVGAGWAARERHLPALKADGRVRVLGVIDRHADRAEALARASALSHSGTSLEEPWVEQADCLTIATPPLEHAPLVRIGLERGWHCLCEKPFAFPAGEAAELVEIARRRGRVLAVVHNFQFAHSGRRLFELVDEGRLGNVEAVYALQLSNPRRRLPAWYKTLPGGLFLDEAPHLLYLLRRILGKLELRLVDARLDGPEIRDLTATFEHQSVWASLSMSFAASVSEWQFVVVGRRAVAALDVFRDLLIVVPNDGGHRAREILRTSARVLAGHLTGSAYSGLRLAGGRLLYGNEEVVRRFVDAVEGRPDQLRWMSGEDGHAVVDCIEGVLRQTGLDPTGASPV